MHAYSTLEPHYYFKMLTLNFELSLRYHRKFKITLSEISTLTEFEWL